MHLHDICEVLSADEARAHSRASFVALSHRAASLDELRQILGELPEGQGRWYVRDWSGGIGRVRHDGRDWAVVEATGHGTLHVLAGWLELRLARLRHSRAGGAPPSVKAEVGTTRRPSRRVSKDVSYHHFRNIAPPCSALTMAVGAVENDGSEWGARVAVALAFCSTADQFSRRRGRAVATGRLAQLADRLSELWARGDGRAEWITGDAIGVHHLTGVVPAAHVRAVIRFLRADPVQGPSGLAVRLGMSWRFRR